MKHTICTLLTALLLAAAPAAERPNAAGEYTDLPLGQTLRIRKTDTVDPSFRDGNPHPSADAAIHIPDTEGMKPARVKKTDLPLSDIQLLLNGLYGDAPLYWYDYPGDRAQVMDMEERMRARLAENKMTAAQREWAENTIARYQAMLDLMPENDLFEPWNGELSQETPLQALLDTLLADHDGPVYTLKLTDVQSRDWQSLGRTCFDVWGSENGHAPGIEYYHRNEANPTDPEDWRKRDVAVGMFRRNMIEPLDPGAYAQAFGGIAITPQDAVSMAEQLLKPFPNMALSGIYYADDHCDDAVMEGGGTVDMPASVEAYVLTYAQRTLHASRIDTEIAINDDGILALSIRCVSEPGLRGTVHAPSDRPHPRNSATMPSACYRPQMTQTAPRKLLPTSRATFLMAERPGGYKT